MSIAEQLVLLKQIKDEIYEVLLARGAAISTSTLFSKYPSIIKNLDVITVFPNVIKEHQEQAYTDYIFTPEKLNDSVSSAYTDTVSYEQYIEEEEE